MNKEKRLANKNMNQIFNISRCMYKKKISMKG